MSENVEDVVDDTNVEEFKVDVEEFKKLKEEKEKMAAALAKANKEAKERRILLNQLSENNLSVEEAIELKKKFEETERTSAERKGDVEKLKEQLENKYSREIKERDEKLKKMQDSLYDHLVSSRAAEALANLDPVKGAGKILMPHVQKYAKVSEEDGKYVVRIVDEDGDVRFNENGDFMTIADFMADLRKDDVLSHLFVQTKNSGGGSKSSTASSEAGSRKRQSQYTREEKIAFIAENGWAAWNKLKK